MTAAETYNYIKDKALRIANRCNELGVEAFKDILPPAILRDYQRKFHRIEYITEKFFCCASDYHMAGLSGYEDCMSYVATFPSSLLDAPDGEELEKAIQDFVAKGREDIINGIKVLKKQKRIEKQVAKMEKQADAEREY